jgi:hypothetical protein
MHTHVYTHTPTHAHSHTHAHNTGIPPIKSIPRASILYNTYGGTRPAVIRMLKERHVLVVNAKGEEGRGERRG